MAVSRSDRSLVAEGLAFGSGFSRWLFHGHPSTRAFRRQRFESTSSARPGPAFMQQNPDQPRRESRPAGELAQVLEGAHPRFLGQFFRLGVVREHRPRDPVEPLVVAAHQDFEQIRLAGRDPPDDLLVGQADFLQYDQARLRLLAPIDGVRTAKKVTPSVTFRARSTLSLSRR